MSLSRSLSLSLSAAGGLLLPALVVGSRAVVVVDENAETRADTRPGTAAAFSCAVAAVAVIASADVLTGKAAFAAAAARSATLTPLTAARSAAGKGERGSRSDAEADAETEAEAEAAVEIGCSDKNGFLPPNFA